MRCLMLAIVMTVGAPALAQPPEEDAREMVRIGSNRTDWCHGTFPNGGAFTYVPEPTVLEWRGQRHDVQGSVWMNDDEVNARDINVRLAEHGLHIEIGPWRDDNGAWQDGELRWIATRAERKLTMMWGGVTAVTRAPGGLLLSWDSGEWGGGLEYLSDAGEHLTLVDDNIRTVFRLGGRTYALSGLAHLASNHGSLWRVDMEGGKPVARKVSDLPGGAPEGWALVEGQAMLVATVEQNVAILADESIEPASATRVCKPN